MGSISAQQVVYLALEGGGAKGLVHLGALKALERQNVHIAGVAGTSAGAIVASLIAAGFRSDEIVDAATGQHILDWLSRHKVEVRDARSFFGKIGWRKLDSFRLLLRLSTAWSSIYVIAGFFCIVVLAIVLLGWLSIALLAIVVGAGVFVLRGLTQVSEFRDILDKALQLKLRGEIGAGPVTFRELGESGRCDLKVIATDLTDRQLYLFSPEVTPDIAVADAVAASICLPIVFAVWPINIDGRTHYFLDGGLVSNLPAWPFDEERTLNPDAITLAVEIIDTVQAKQPEIGRTRWLVPAVRTAIFGSGQLNKRAISRLEVVPLATEIDVLDFDIERADVARIVNNAYFAAEARIVKRLIEDPETLQKAADAVRQAAINGLESILQIPKASGRVRTAIGMPEPGHRYSIRLRPCSGYDGTDTDIDMLLPIEGSFIGAAWKTREAVFQTVPFAPEFSLPGAQNDHRRRLVWKGMQWSFSVPILWKTGEGAGKPRFIVAVDGDHVLNMGDARLDEFLSRLADRINLSLDSVADDLGGKDEGQHSQARFDGAS